MSYEYNQSEIFGDSYSEDILSNSLKQSCSINGLKNLRLDNNKLNKLTNFLKCFSKSNESISFNFVSQTHDVTRYKINSQMAATIMENIKYLEYDNIEELFYFGRFIAVNLQRKTFVFISKEEVEIKGSFDSSIYNDMESISFRCDYRININKKESKDINKRIKSINTLTQILQYIPNQETIAAIEEPINNSKRYDCLEAMWADLEND